MSKKSNFPCRSHFALSKEDHQRYKSVCKDLGIMPGTMTRTLILRWLNQEMGLTPEGFRSLIQQWKEKEDSLKEQLKQITDHIQVITGEKKE